MDSSENFSSIFLFNSRRRPLNGSYWGTLLFVQSKDFYNPMFLKDVFTRFHNFWNQTGAVILVTLTTGKQEVERKSKGFSRVKFFTII